MNHFAFGILSKPIFRQKLMSHCSGGDGMAVPQTKGFTRGMVAGAFVAAALLAAATVPALGQVGPPVTTGRPTDWTHHRLVFSNPGTLADADKKGKTAHVQAVLHDTRFVLQQMKVDPKLRPNVTPGGGPDKGSKTKGTPIHKDWSKVLSVGLVNPNAFPAKYSFSTTTFSCTSDFVVYPTGIAGATTTQATIVAFDELYGTSGPSGTGCGAGAGGGAVPLVDWAYNTAYSSALVADNSLVKTSPVLSLDGTQVAFIQATTGGGAAASLILLKPSTGTSVVALNTASTNVAAASYRTCNAPCMTRLILSGAPIDSFSAPFYDYANDMLYVGDDNGTLHKFTNVFVSGTPTEVSTGFPVQVSALANNNLTSPVYDPGTGRVFVGDNSGVLYSVTASTGVLFAKSAVLSQTATGGFYDSPLVDSSAQTVYAFLSTSKAQAGGCAKNDNCVYQFPTTFTGSGTSVGTSEPIGVGNGGGGLVYLWDGEFDNIYYSSTNGTAGNLYVVGNNNAGGGTGNLYRVPITNTGAMGTPVATAVNKGGQSPFPSPVTEFCNNGTSACVASGTATTSGTDFIFFSVYNGTGGTCVQTAGHGCVVAYDVTSGTPVFSSFLDELYGNTTFKCFVTGGLVVDNAIPTGTEAGASEIYFMGLGGTTANLCGGGATGAASLFGIQSAQ